MPKSDTDEPDSDCNGNINGYGYGNSDGDFHGNAGSIAVDHPNTGDYANARCHTNTEPGWPGTGAQPLDPYVGSSC